MEGVVNDVAVLVFELFCLVTNIGHERNRD